MQRIDNQKQRMNNIKQLGDDQNDISMPFQIKALLKDWPDYEIGFMDYDYIGNAKETDFVSFANQLYGVFETFPNMILIIHSDEMTDNQLLRKMFRFDLTEYCFNEKTEMLTLPINESQIVFLGIIPINTPEDVKDAIRFLFSGIYESYDFIMYSKTPFDIKHIKDLLKDSLQIVRNRHGDIQKVFPSISYICQHKDNLKILYPYGGTDFGSFMLFDL